MARFLLKLMLFSVLIFGVDRLAGTLLKQGIDRYFGFDRNAAVLLVGHSHTMMGIDAGLLERSLGMPVAKYAVNGANVFDRQAMLRQYLGDNPGRIKLVVYDVDDHTFTSDVMSSNSYRLLYPYIGNADMSGYLQANAGSWGEYFSRRYLLLSLRFNAAVLNLSLRGLLGLFDNFKTGLVDILSLEKDIQAGRRPGILIDPRYVNALEETIREVRSRGAKLVFCYIPTVDLLSRMDPARHTQVVDMFRRYDRNDDGVEFFNYQETFGSRYELFSDAIHLNREGQQIFTARLKMDLQPVLSQ
jgi:hypothetical protein